MPWMCFPDGSLRRITVLFWRMNGFFPLGGIDYYTGERTTYHIWTRLHVRLSLSWVDQRHLPHLWFSVHQRHSSHLVYINHAPSLCHCWVVVCDPGSCCPVHEANSRSVSWYFTLVLRFSLSFCLLHVSSFWGWFAGLLKSGLLHLGPASSDCTVPPYVAVRNSKLLAFKISFLLN